ncbi:MAG TPA: ABC transporter ATP-binding protein [Chloroflexota bacterium]|nr:ABC transporter ATP-binding protein [Chloroflexota bacterium]
MATATQPRTRSDVPAANDRPGAPVIELVGLTLGYDGQEIIRNLSLAVTPGQIYGLVGPSGGGKTTLLRAALGLLQPMEGEARLFGEPALTLPRRLRQRIGYMPQSFALYPNLTVRENLDFVAGLYGLGWRHRRRRIRETLDTMDLSEHRGKVARDLSGGMQRRLQLAAALLHEPSLLVVDEPTAGIDPVLRARCWEEFRAIADSGRTVFFTTQYVNEAEQCDYVALVAGGGLLAEGTPAALRRLAYGGDVVDLASPCLDWSAVSQVARLPLVLGVDRAAPGWVRVLVEDAARATPELVRALEDANCHVEAADASQPSFDEVFTRLVERRR